MKRIVGIFMISTLLWSGCVREVKLDIPEPPERAVMICHFAPDRLFRANISYSRPIEDPGASTAPEQAEVTLSADGQFLDRLRRKKDNETGLIFWESDELAKPDIQYTLVVRIPGLPAAEASSTAPSYIGLRPLNINLDSIRTDYLGEGQSRLLIPLELQLEELPDYNRFFAFSLSYEMDVYEDDALERVEYSYTKSNTSFLTDGKTFTLLHALVEPVVMINERFWDADRRSLNLDALIPMRSNEKPREIRVEWRTLSAEFYRYHLSLSRQSTNAPFSDPDALFNDVTDGYGNFSGYSTRTYVIALP